MNGFDTFKRYNPVTLIGGIGFICVGLFDLKHLSRTSTIEGKLFVGLLFVAIPVSLGAVVIRNQLKLRRLGK